MKNLITLVICLNLTSLIFGQEKLLDILPTQNGVVTYSGVVQVDSSSKNELYSRAKQWFIQSYKSAKDVIQLEDKETGEIIGKGTFQINYYTREPYISHTVSIYVKDGRYKYIIFQFSYSDNQGEKFNIENFPSSWAGKRKLYSKIDEEVLLLISSIEKGMKKNVVSDDW